MMNKRTSKYLKLCLLAGLVAAGSSNAMAQRMIRVSGKVYNAAEIKKKVPITNTEVIVYRCKTLGEAENLQKELDADKLDIGMVVEPDSYTKIDKNGYYEILVPDNGAIIFKADMTKSVLVKVNNQMKIDVSIDVGRQLDEVVITGIRTELEPEPSIGGMMGDLFIVSNKFVIPQQMGNQYSRFIIQPYTVMCNGAKNDTVDFSEPIVIDGKEFRKAQDRKMGFDLTRDPLERFIRKDISLTRDRINVSWNDTIKVPDPKISYSCYADFILENFNTKEYEKNFQIVSCKNKRPMQFMEYTLISKDMDFMSEFNRERAQIEKRNSVDKVSLNFEISSANLVQSQENLNNMSKIKTKLQEILNEPGATLKELYITGYASPEGQYYSNLNLAELRSKTIMNDVVSILPASVNKSLYKYPSASVRPWSEVVDMLKEDNKLDVAKEIQEIIDMHPDNITKQSANISQLKSYRSTIVQYLERLRQVEYRINFDIYREPNDEEVLAGYKNKGLNGVYTRYEYWKLFQLLKGKELEQIALKAYNESVKEERPWPLAANIVAVEYLKRDTCDVKLLEPLVDKSVYITNYKKRNDKTNRIELVNPVEIVNNLLCMYIKSNNFSDASIMAQLLPDTEEFSLIKAYAWALGGYYKGGRNEEERARCQKTFETIKNSSKKNEVVMYLALDTKAGNKMAEEALKDFSADDALTWYFKAIISARKGDSGFSETMMNLYQCFSLDKNFIFTAKNDGEFTDEVVEEAENML